MNAVERYRAQQVARGVWDEQGNRTPTYREALLTQTRLWMMGISTHCRLSGECCPDFSCCHPEMLTAAPDRVARGKKMLMDLGEGMVL